MGLGMPEIPERLERFAQVRPPIGARIADSRRVDAVRQARLLWAYRIGGNMGTYSNLTWQLLVQFLIVLFLVVAVSGLAVGVGLIASSPKIVGYFHTLNRWVSTRHVLRPVEEIGRASCRERV